ncbi:amino acid transporter [Elysia marginata]|uniref:Amino acid transporter n=1 Tax=Elysia marginata TaxID=1093978 RepID=A0AAV4K103_9GAST|nr:amino acid transporter [Elysia marginata]
MDPKLGDTRASSDVEGPGHRQGSKALDRGSNRGLDARRARTLARSFLKENILILLTLLGIVVGFAIGLTLQHVKPSPDVLQWIGVPGEIFLRSLKATIVPIIVCMVITATASVDPTMNRRIVVVGVLSFFVTAVLAVITATILFLMLKPGRIFINAASPTSDIKTSAVYRPDCAKIELK